MTAWKQRERERERQKTKHGVSSRRETGVRKAKDQQAWRRVITELETGDERKSRPEIETERSRGRRRAARESESAEQARGKGRGIFAQAHPLII